MRLRNWCLPAALLCSSIVLAAQHDDVDANYYAYVAAESEDTVHLVRFGPNGGEVVKSGKDKGSQFAATRAAERMADALKDKEFTELVVKFRAPGGNRSIKAPQATAAIRALTRAGMTVSRIVDVTPIAHDGTKKKGGRRGRRV